MDVLACRYEVRDNEDGATCDQSRTVGFAGVENTRAFGVATGCCSVDTAGFAVGGDDGEDGQGHMPSARGSTPCSTTASGW